MSKITLEPNSSGAGTFSIVSPDSNTNRTLNLPDEAGKILSTGNDNPAEVFKQSNILGTVSESGGVPTGAIIERGSNANGEFIKYADGTMICGGLVPNGSYPREVTYPANFSATPRNPGGTNNNASSLVDIFAADNNTGSGFAGRWDRRTDTFGDYVAIGRWY